jgi:tetratricopeptide (TPR) repeat protein
LLILTYALFYQNFYHDWTIDDFSVLVNNPDTKSLSGFFDDTRPGRPLRELTFLLDFVAFGNNPFGYHFQQLFWHGLNAILVYVLARKLFSRSLPAFFGALLFLVHPLNVEVVANISNRKDSLSLAFSIFSVLIFGWAHQSQKSRRLVLFLGSVILYLVACQAKQNALLVPLLWFAYEYRFISPDQRLLAKLSPIKSLMVLFGLSCTAYIWKLISIGGIGKLQSNAWEIISRANYYPKPDLTDYVQLLLKFWGTMIPKIIWPVNLAPAYAIPAPGTWFDFQIVLSIITIIAALALLFHSGKQHNSNVFFALVWCLVFWLPVSNLWPSVMLAADRYWYAILPGLIFLFLHAAEKFVEIYRKTAVTIITCICVFFAFQSFQQSQHWSNNAVLWEHTLAVNPESSVANHNMGITLYLSGKPRQAIKYLNKALSLSPYDQKCYYNLYQIFTKIGQHTLAQEALEKSRRPPPWKSH